MIISITSKSVVVCTNHIYIYTYSILYDMLKSFNRGGVKLRNAISLCVAPRIKAPLCTRLLNNIVSIL